jgi:hypothetical protein
LTVPNVPAGLYRVRARNDPDGESNSVELKVKSDVDDSSLQGSIKGGIL